MTQKFASQYRFTYKAWRSAKRSIIRRSSLSTTFSLVWLNHWRVLVSIHYDAWFKGTIFFFNHINYAFLALLHKTGWFSRWFFSCRSKFTLLRLVSVLEAMLIRCRPLIWWNVFFMQSFTSRRHLISPRVWFFVHNCLCLFILIV